MSNRPMRPLPARLSPRAGTGTRRALRRLTRSPMAAHLRASTSAAFPSLAIGLGLVVGLTLLVATRGQFAAWDGFHAIPTGDAR